MNQNLSKILVHAILAQLDRTGPHLGRRPTVGRVLPAVES